MTVLDADLTLIQTGLGSMRSALACGEGNSAQLEQAATEAADALARVAGRLDTLETIREAAVRVLATGALPTDQEWADLDRAIARAVVVSRERTEEQT